MNPFEREFKAFASTLTTKNNAGHVEAVAGKAGEVFKDKPFSVEYRTLYTVSKIAQGAAQVVTFLTTAGLGAWALEQVIVASWGVFVAVPLGILFACLVELVKRSTLAIAAKHLFKYKSFGGVSVVALAVMLVSIGAALLGAKELPEVVFPKPQRAPDAAMVATLNTDLEHVQKDIDRATGRRALARLQQQRADLIGKRDAAALDAGKRADVDHSEAVTDRAAHIQKMQIYSVGAAIVAEAVFLVATFFILLYLFRCFAEVEQAEAEKAQMQQKPTNGQYKYSTAQNLSIRPEVITATINVPRARGDDFRTTPPTDANTRICLHCNKPYTYRHVKQKYCSDDCRVTAWEAANGKTLRAKHSSAT
jgi:hypothetical protein